MIRPELLKHVHKVLSSHPYLALEDFAVTEVLNKSQDPCLSIIYRAKKEFFFVFHIPTSRSIPSQDSSYQGYLFACSISPGRESVQESYVAQERRQLLFEINEWLKRLHADIVSAPAIRQFQTQSAAIDQLRQHLRNCQMNLFPIMM